VIKFLAKLEEIVWLPVATPFKVATGDILKLQLYTV